MTNIDRLDDDHRRVVEALPTDLFDLRDLAAARDRVGRLRPASPPPAEVEIRDVVVPGPASTVPVRTYADPTNRTPTPMMVWMHGGGFVLGDAASGDATCAALVRELGLVVVSVDYRLAPECAAPAALEDCYAALVWAVERDHSLAVDRSMVAVGGVSAGGGLAAAVALAARDRDGPLIGYQLLTSPMLDDRTSAHLPSTPLDHRFWTHEANRIAWGAYLGARTDGWEIAVPSRAENLAGLPPAHISVGDLDLFLEENVAYADRLRVAGSSVRLDVYEGAFHGSHALVAHSPVSQRWRAAELDGLRRWMAADR